MSMNYLRLVAAVLATIIVWQASQALKTGGPVAVLSLVMLVFAVATLISTTVNK